MLCKLEAKGNNTIQSEDIRGGGGEKMRAKITKICAN